MRYAETGLQKALRANLSFDCEGVEAADGPSKPSARYATRRSYIRAEQGLTFFAKTGGGLISGFAACRRTLFGRGEPPTLPQDSEVWLD